MDHNLLLYSLFQNLLYLILVFFLRRKILGRNPCFQQQILFPHDKTWLLNKILYCHNSFSLQKKYYRLIQAVLS